MHRDRINFLRTGWVGGKKGGISGCEGGGTIFKEGDPSKKKREMEEYNLDLNNASGTPHEETKAKEERRLNGKASKEGEMFISGGENSMTE